MSKHPEALRMKLFLQFQHATFSDISEHLSRMIKHIQNQHYALHAQSIAGFWYNNEFYGEKYHKKFRYVCALDFHLEAEMEQYLTLKTGMDYEMRYINSFLQASLTSCVNLGQMYHVLPSALHEVLRRNNIEAQEIPPEIHDAILKYNQKGYDMLLHRILQNTVGYAQ